MRYEQLLYSTSPRSNIRSDVDNFIIKISCYDKRCLVVNGYSRRDLSLGETFFNISEFKFV